MLEITLKINGKNKKFTQAKMTLGAMRRMAEMDKNIKQLNENNNPEDVGMEVLDEMSMTVVKLFGDQFTFNEFIDGLEFDTMDDFTEIVQGLFEKVGSNEGK